MITAFRGIRLGVLDRNCTHIVVSWSSPPPLFCFERPPRRSRSGAGVGSLSHMILARRHLATCRAAGRACSCVAACIACSPHTLAAGDISLYRPPRHGACIQPFGTRASAWRSDEDDLPAHAWSSPDLLDHTTSMERSSRSSTVTSLGTIFLGPSIFKPSLVFHLHLVPWKWNHFSYLTLYLISSYPKVKCFFAVGNNFTFVIHFFNLKSNLYQLIYTTKYYYFPIDCHYTHFLIDSLHIWWSYEIWLPHYNICTLSSTKTKDMHALMFLPLFQLMYAISTIYHNFGENNIYNSYKGNYFLLPGSS